MSSTGYSLITFSKYPLFMFNFFGLWTKNNKTSKFFNKLLKFFFHLIFTFIFIILMVINLFKISNLKNATESLYITLTEIALLTKLIILYKNRKNIMHLIELINHNDFLIKNLNNQKMIKSHEKFLFKIYKLYSFISISAALSAYAVPLFAQIKIFPFPAWYPFNWENNNLIYILLYIYQIIGMTMHCLLNVNNDIFYAYIMFIVHMQLIVLGENLRKLNNKNKKIFIYNENNYNEEFLHLIKCVKHHRFIIR